MPGNQKSENTGFVNTSLGTQLCIKTHLISNL